RQQLAALARRAPPPGGKRTCSSRNRRVDHGVIAVGDFSDHAVVERIANRKPTRCAVPLAIDEGISREVHDRSFTSQWYRRPMTDRSRVVLIFAAVAILGGGAGFYFFKIYQPAQELKAAQDEINGWEARYQGARDCLLGKSPGSSKTSEALAIHEMAPDPWDRGKCTPLISKLSRGVSNDSGIDRIETAWTDLDKAAHKAALAFATHV